MPNLWIPIFCTMSYPNSLWDFTFCLTTSQDSRQKLFGFCSLINLYMTMGGSFFEQMTICSFWGHLLNQGAASLLPSWNYFPAWHSSNSHHSCWHSGSWRSDLWNQTRNCLKLEGARVLWASQVRGVGYDFQWDPRRENGEKQQRFLLPRFRD